MRRIGDLMKDMGFNADAPLETQKAFIRHLIAAANGAAPRAPVAEAPEAPATQAPPKSAAPKGAQLCFDPDILGTQLRAKSGSR